MHWGCCPMGLCLRHVWVCTAEGLSLRSQTCLQVLCLSYWVICLWHEATCLLSDLGPFCFQKGYTLKLQLLFPRGLVSHYLPTHTHTHTPFFKKKKWAILTSEMHTIALHNVLDPSPVIQMFICGGSETSHILLLEMVAPLGHVFLEDQESAIELLLAF